jgi:hypothetical protein
MSKPITENRLFYGDDLRILREHIPTEDDGGSVGKSLGAVCGSEGNHDTPRPPRSQSAQSPLGGGSTACLRLNRRNMTRLMVGGSEERVLFLHDSTQRTLNHAGIHFVMSGDSIAGSPVKAQFHVKQKVSVVLPIFIPMLGHCSVRFSRGQN